MWERYPMGTILTALIITCVVVLIAGKNDIDKKDAHVVGWLKKNRAILSDKTFFPEIWKMRVYTVLLLLSIGLTAVLCFAAFQQEDREFLQKTLFVGVLVTIILGILGYIQRKKF